MDYIQIENETSSVIRFLRYLSDRLEAEVTDVRRCTGVLQQPWHSHAGPQYISFFGNSSLIYSLFYNRTLLIM